MRIAYLTTCSPLPVNSGHSLRVNAVWQALREFGDVRLYAFNARLPFSTRTVLRAQGIVLLPGRHEAQLALFARHARSFMGDRSMLYAKAYSTRRMHRLAKEIKAWKTDLLVIGDTWIADLLPELRDSAHKVVVDTHNVESHLYARITKEKSWIHKLKFFLFYRNVCHLERNLLAADGVWTASRADARVYREDFGLPNVTVLPNAIDTIAYAPQEAAAEPRTIVFTGTYSYWPNEAAALHLIHLSRRLERAGVRHRMLIVGRGPTPAMLKQARHSPSVTVTGPVPDIRAFIARAALIAAPLSSGSGTKYKILEALALGRPVLTTTMGAEGLELRDGVEAAIVPDLTTFDARLSALLDRPLLNERMGAAGRAWVVQTHSLEALGSALDSALKTLGYSRVHASAGRAADR